MGFGLDGGQSFFHFFFFFFFRFLFLIFFFYPMLLHVFLSCLCQFFEHMDVTSVFFLKSFDLFTSQLFSQIFVDNISGCIIFFSFHFFLFCFWGSGGGGECYFFAFAVLSWVMSVYVLLHLVQDFFFW